MKIDAISCYTSTPKYNNAKNLKYSPSFNGIFDVFQKQNQLSEEQQIDISIKKLVKSAIQTDKSLKKYAKYFFKQLNLLLLKGRGQDYKGSFSYINPHGKRKSFSFSDVDKDMNIPSVVNKWENGQLKTTYEISSNQPALTYKVTDYEEHSNYEYYFINKTYLGYCFSDDSGQIIKQFASKGGFFQQRAQVTDGRAILLTEVYYDYKKPEESFFRENTSEGVVEYGYDKNKNLWSERKVISQEEYDAKFSES